MTGVLAALLGGGPGADLPATINVSDSSLYPADAICSFQINIDGTIYKYGTVDSTVKWLFGGSASAYSVRLVTSDTPYTGSDATNTWLALTSSRDWICRENNQGTTTVTGTLQLAFTSDTSVILDSATVSMEATSEI